MGEEDAALVGRSGEKSFVGGSCQSDILGSNDIEIGLFAEERPENIVVEVFVGEPAQHGYWRRARRRSRMPSGRQWDSFDRLTSSAAAVRFAR